LFIAIKEKLDVIQHQQQIILQGLGNTRPKSTPHILGGFCLLAQSFDHLDDVQMMEKRLHSLDKQSSFGVFVQSDVHRISDGHVQLFYSVHLLVVGQIFISCHFYCAGLSLVCQPYHNPLAPVFIVVTKCIKLG
jgi:hypothetical protein